MADRQRLETLKCGSGEQWRRLVGMCQIIFFILVWFNFSLKKTQIRFGMSLVQLGSKNVVRFGYYR